MKGWITGSRGFIGQAFGAQKLPFPLMPLQHRPEAPLLWEQPEWEEGDLLLHLGWHVHPRDYLYSPENLRCLEGSRRLINAALEAGLHVVGVGSCLEYGPGCIQQPEEALLRPVSLYAQCKAKLGLEFSVHPHFTWARLFHLFGAGEHPDRLVPSVLRSLKNGERVPLLPANIRRDWLPVQDVARALSLLLDQHPGGCFNLCSGQSWSLEEFLGPAAAELWASHLLDFGARTLENPADLEISGAGHGLHRLGFQPQLPAPLALLHYVRTC